MRIHLKAKARTAAWLVHAFAALLPVIASRPHRVLDGVTCPFVKTLPQKLGAGPTKMDPLLFPALLHFGALDGARNTRIEQAVVGHLAGELA